MTPMHAENDNGTILCGSFSKYTRLSRSIDEFIKHQKYETHLLCKKCLKKIERNNKAKHK